MLVVCIANGASLTREDVNLCKNHIVYAVKEAYHIATWAKVMYCADGDWWQKTNGCAEFNGDKYTCDLDAANKWGLRYIKADNSIVWSKDKAVIATGGNSGFQAINLAYLHGATSIILLGYDYGYINKKHWYDDSLLNRQSRWSDYKDWIRRIDMASKQIDIPVVNCSPLSAIECFPKMDIENALRIFS